MKYSMVRQFSNNAIDNLFKFFFKISDFFKILLDTFLAFIDIWYTFFLIFYNMLMYIYYLFLFAIERGTESDKTTFIWKRSSRLGSYSPNLNITDGPNPIPAMYRVTEKISKSAESAASSAKSTISSMSSSSTKKAKSSFFKTIGEGIVNFFITLADFITLPFKSIIKFFDRRLKPTREKETIESKSLIDEYMKEYKQKKA